VKFFFENFFRGRGDRRSQTPTLLTPRPVRISPSVLSPVFLPGVSDA
jgi:hypothetical protein